MNGIAAQPSSRVWMPRWRVGPPGTFFYLAMLAVLGIALEGSSRESFGRLLLAVILGFAVFAIWLVRLAIGLPRTRLRMTLVHWVRWLGIPTALVLGFVLAQSDVPFMTRLALSRSAMDHMAADVSAGGSIEREWVGLYQVRNPQPTANGFRFVIDNSGLSRRGFAYSADGEPELTESNYSPLWTGIQFESIGGGWWYWTEAWD